jgi:hypothetical protein
LVLILLVFIFFILDLFVNFIFFSILPFNSKNLFIFSFFFQMRSLFSQLHFLIFQFFYFIIRYFIYWDLVSLVFSIVSTPYPRVNLGHLSGYKSSRLTQVNPSQLNFLCYKKKSKWYHFEKEKEKEKESTGYDPILIGFSIGKPKHGLTQVFGRLTLD